jgi:hypothetical protein
MFKTRGLALIVLRIAGAGLLLGAGCGRNDPGVSPGAPFPGTATRQGAGPAGISPMGAIPTTRPATSHPSDIDVVLQAGSPGWVEVFAQIDPAGHRRYRMVVPNSGRRVPLADDRGSTFPSLPELAEGIRATPNTQVVATDPNYPTSMWLTGDIPMEPLTDDERAQIAALLAQDRKGH